MKYVAAFLMTMAVLWTTVPAQAEAKPRAKAAPAPVVKKADSDKDKLIANLNNMRNQEVRVIILQQLINEEVAKLNEVQESFCKTYKLDVDKLRQGLYRYDDDKGKFVESKVEQAGR